MESSPAIAKVCTKIKLGQQQTDFAYWQTQPHARRLSDAPVHLVVTSPPYWQLKDYGRGG